MFLYSGLIIKSPVVVKSPIFWDAVRASTKPLCLQYDSISYFFRACLTVEDEFIYTLYPRNSPKAININPAKKAGVINRRIPNPIEAIINIHPRNIPIWVKNDAS